MKINADKIICWMKGFFEEGTSGVPSSKRLTTILSSFAALVLSFLLAGLVIGLALQVKQEVQKVETISILIDGIIYLVGIAITGGAFSYVFGNKRKEPQKFE